MRIELSKITESLESGKRPKGGALSKGIPSLGAEHLNSDGGFNLNKLKYVDEVFFSKMNKGIVKVNDIIIVKDGATTGKVSFVDMRFPLSESCVNEHVFILRVKDSADPKYVFYYLFSNQGKHEVLRDFRGATVGGISKSFLNKVKIPLPPLPIQKKIADILDAADAYRQKTKALIAKYDELAQSLFLDMFGDPVRNEKGWEKHSLNQYCDIISGYPFKSKNYQESGVPICGGLIIMPDFIDWSKSKYWNEDETVGIENYFLEENDIVIAMDRPWINSGFKIGVIDKRSLPCLLIQRTARVRCLNIPTKYVYYNLKSSAFRLHCIPTETTVPHITLREIRDFEIPAPPDDLVIQFDKMIGSIDEQKESVKKNYVKSDQLFKALLNKAFKGELFV